MCDFICNEECKNCDLLKFDIVGYEVKCNGKCNECPCKGCSDKKDI